MSAFASNVNLTFNFPNIIHQYSRIWTFYFAKHYLPKKQLVFYNKKILKITE
jgi:hypothetical protein